MTKTRTTKERLPDRTISFNKTKRLLYDNGYGVYVLYLDKKDADYLDKVWVSLESFEKALDNFTDEYNLAWHSGNPLSPNQLRKLVMKCCGGLK